MVTKRQQAIIKIIVDDYVKSVTPISSEQIVRNHDLGVSPATIRNDVAALEEFGYITRPHTSAGSVPMDSAYRLYVEDRLASDRSGMTSSARNKIRQQLGEVEADVDAWTNVAAGLLAELVGNLAVATFPRSREYRVRHLELVPLQDLIVMLIVVLGQARLRRHLIRLQDPVERSDLEALTNKMNAHLAGLSHKDIESKVMNLTPFETELVNATSLILKEEERASTKDHYVNGLRNLLGQPEFYENEKMRAVVGGVEDGSLVEEILKEAPDGNVVRVVIGQEHDGDVLWPLSVVICQYGVPDEALGAVGVVGPTRMEYARAISGVRYMSALMSELVENVST